MILRISHTQRSTDPRFPGNPANQVTPILAIHSGDQCNAAEVRMFNHNGTHIDCPNHYVASRERLAEYDLAEFEDIDLAAAAIIERFHRVFVVQLFIDGVDSMPCTMFGEYDA